MDAKSVKKSIQDAARNLAAKLDEVRADIVDAKSEIKWIEGSPLCLADAISKINEYVDGHATDDGITTFFYGYRTESEGIFNIRSRVDIDDLIVPFAESGQVRGSIVSDLSSMMCSLFPAEMKSKLVEMATRAAPDIVSGPPLAERPNLIAATEQRLNDLEVEEEKIIETAEELGLSGFYRRHDCNPSIVLMLEVVQ